MLRNAVIAVVIGWAVLGAALAGYVLLFATFALADSPWNFPGDPPWFEVFVYAAGVATVVNAPLLVVTKRWSLGGFISLHKVSTVSTLLCLFVFTVAGVGILERHDARWAAIRNGIRQYGDEIAAAAGSKERVLTEAEFAEFKSRFLPTPVQLRLAGYGTVTLRMAHGVYPYVGVDFGDGANAFFDPRTMFCIYSD